jgi:hypothetical protein
MAATLGDLRATLLDALTSGRAELPDAAELHGTLQLADWRLAPGSGDVLPACLRATDLVSDFPFLVPVSWGPPAPYDAAAAAAASAAAAAAAAATAAPTAAAAAAAEEEVEVEVEGGAAAAAAPVPQPLYEQAWCWSDESEAPCGPMLTVGSEPLVGSHEEGSGSLRAALAAALREACEDAEGDEAGGGGRGVGGASSGAAATGAAPGATDAERLRALLARLGGPLGLPLHMEGSEESGEEAQGSGSGSSVGPLAVQDDWESDALDLGYAQPPRAEVAALHARAAGRATSVRPYLLNKACQPASDDAGDIVRSVFSHAQQGAVHSQLVAAGEEVGRLLRALRACPSEARAEALPHAAALLSLFSRLKQTSLLAGLRRAAEGSEGLLYRVLLQPAPPPAPEAPLQQQAASPTAAAAAAAATAFASSSSAAAAASRKRPRNAEEGSGAGGAGGAGAAASPAASAPPLRPLASPPPAASAAPAAAAASRFPEVRCAAAAMEHVRSAGAGVLAVVAQWARVGREVRGVQSAAGRARAGAGIRARLCAFSAAHLRARGAREVSDKLAADAELKVLLGEGEGGEGGASSSSAASRMLDRLSLGDEAAGAVFARRQAAAERSAHLEAHGGRLRLEGGLAGALGALAARLEAGLPAAAQLRAQASLQRAGMQAFLALDAAFAQLLACLLGSGGALARARRGAAREGAAAAAALEGHRAFYADAAPGIEAQLRGAVEAAGAQGRAVGEALAALGEGLRAPALAGVLEALPLELRQTLATRVQCLLPSDGGGAAGGGGGAGAGAGGEEAAAAAVTAAEAAAVASAFDPLLMPTRLKTSGLRSFSALAPPTEAALKAASLPIPSLRHMSMFTLGAGAEAAAAVAAGEGGWELMRPLLRAIAPILGRANARLGSSSGGGGGGGGGGGSSVSGGGGGGSSSSSSSSSSCSSSSSSSSSSDSSSGSSSAGAAAAAGGAAAVLTHLSLFDAGALFAPGTVPPVAAVTRSTGGAGGGGAAAAARAAAAAAVAGGGGGAEGAGRDAKRARTLPPEPPAQAQGEEVEVEMEEEEGGEEEEEGDEEEEDDEEGHGLPADKEEEGWCSIA